MRQADLTRRSTPLMFAHGEIKALLLRHMLYALDFGGGRSTP